MRELVEALEHQQGRWRRSSSARVTRRRGRAGRSRPAGYGVTTPAAARGSPGAHAARRPDGRSVWRPREVLLLEPRHVVRTGAQDRPPGPRALGRLLADPRGGGCRLQSMSPADVDDEHAIATPARSSATRRHRGIRRRRRARRACAGSARPPTPLRPRRRTCRARWTAARRRRDRCGGRRDRGSKAVATMATAPRRHGTTRT